MRASDQSKLRLIERFTIDGAHVFIWVEGQRHAVTALNISPHLVGLTTTRGVLWVEAGQIQAVFVPEEARA